MRAVALMIVAVSCLACDVQARLADLSKLQDALQSQFHETVEINERPNELLTITVVLPQQPADEVSTEVAAQQAFHIAQYARAHYVRAATLHAIAVHFVVAQTAGPLTISRTYAGGSWPIDALTSDSATAHDSL